MQYTITLADGRKLTGLGKNGDNFVSKTKVDETIFKNNLSTMIISDGETEETFHNMVFIQQMEWMDGTFYLAFREQTKQEKMLSELKIAYEQQQTQNELNTIAMQQLATQAELNQIEAQQAMTDLELMMMEVKSK